MPTPGILDASLTAEIEMRFTYHPPCGDQAERYKEIRDEGKQFAFLLAGYCPKSPDLTKALNHLDIAVMLANAAIARNEVYGMAKDDTVPDCIPDPCGTYDPEMSAHNESPMDSMSNAGLIV